MTRIEGNAASGETIDVCDFQGKWLARAAFSPQSQIRARVWTFDQQEAVDRDFFINRLQTAQQWRTCLAEQCITGLVVNDATVRCGDATNDLFAAF